MSKGKIIRIIILFILVLLDFAVIGFVAFKAGQITPRYFTNGYSITENYLNEYPESVYYLPFFFVLLIATWCYAFALLGYERKP